MIVEITNVFFAPNVSAEIPPGKVENIYPIPKAPRIKPTSLSEN